MNNKQKYYRLIKGENKIKEVEEKIIKEKFDINSINDGGIGQTCFAWYSTNKKLLQKFKP